MPIKKRKKRWPLLHEDQLIIDAMKAIKEFNKKATSSPRAARKALQDAGILDKKGRLHKHYRR